MGYKTKSMINQASGIDAFSLLNKETKKIGVSSAIPKSGFGSGKLNKGFNVGYNSKNLSSNSESTNISKEKPSNKLSDRAFKKQAKSIGTYINEGGERGYKKSQRKEAREVGREAAKDVDTSFKKAELAGTDFNSLLIGTIQNISASAAASSKKRKVKRAAKKEHKEFQKKGSSNFDGEGLTKGFKGADLPKIDSGIKTGDFFQDTFVKFNPDRDKRIKKQASDKIKEKKLNELAPENVFKEQVKPMYNYGPTAPSSNPVDMNQSFGRKIYDVTVKTGEDAKRILTREGSKGMEKQSRDLFHLAKQDASNSGKYIKKNRKLTQQFTKDKAFAEKLLRTGTNNPFSVSQDVVDKFDDNIKTGVPMLGDGFNKGMLRKNKYKK